MKIASSLKLRFVVASGLTAALIGCGSSKPAKTVSQSSSEETASNGSAETGDGGSSEATPKKPRPTIYAKKPGSNGDAPAREIQYVVTQEGLEVRVEGVHFLANATAQKVRNGWGVRLDVSAVVKDDATHSILKPDNGPLALAGVVDRGGSTEKFRDDRRGDKELELKPGKAVKWTSTWPGKQQKPLTKGQNLELQVGLWGIGATATERRPVQNFFHVKMDVANGKPQAQIGPPPTAKNE
jgi:hypothetical protein